MKQYAVMPGRLELARVYLRRGSVYGDVTLLGRAELVEGLKSGQKAVLGRRLSSLGGTFETGPVLCLEGNLEDEHLVCGTSQGEGDRLCDAPVF